MRTGTDDVFITTHEEEGMKESPEMVKIILIDLWEVELSFFTNKFYPIISIKFVWYIMLDYI